MRPAPWPHDDASWTEVVACVREALAPFHVEVVEADPGAVDHTELVFTTAWPEPTQVPYASQGPATCTPLPRAIGFVMGDVVGDTRQLGWRLQQLQDVDRGLRAGLPVAASGPAPSHPRGPHSAPAMSPRMFAMCLVTLAVGCNQDKPKSSSQPEPSARSSEKTPPAEPAAGWKPPAKPIATPPPGFIPVAIPLLGVTVHAPPGATVTEDALGLVDSTPQGVVVAADKFAVHIYYSFMTSEPGDVRTAAVNDGATFTETKADPTFEYTIAKDGVTRYGLLHWSRSMEKGQLVCGTVAPVATPEELATVRDACSTVAKQ